MNKDLLEIIVSDLESVIKSSKGLEVYAEGNNSFEQWMQVVVCGALKNECAENVEVETTHGGFSPDICFQRDNQKYAIELKVIIKSSGKKSGRRSDLGKILDDMGKLEKLAHCGIDNRIILFAIFPWAGEEEFGKWVQKGAERKKHYAKIYKKLNPKLHEFVFCNGTKGCIFYGILR